MFTIAFIDNRLTDIQALIQALPENTEIVLLDSENEGLSQITQALANAPAWDAIRIFSHGNVGALQLGSTWLDASNLQAYSASLVQIGKTLKPDGDLVLYGCNVAQGTAGQAFIQQLAQLTAADVAASDDLTGNSGDWQLEAATGVIAYASLALNEEALTHYADTLEINTAPYFVSGTGKVTTDISGDYDIGRAVYTQTDGKILIAGYSALSDFALVRYNSDGSLDVSFDNDGITTHDFGWNDTAYAIALQTDDKILIAGQGNSNFALVRYNSDGSLDTSFDGDGTVTTAIGTFTGGVAQAIALQTDGKILVAGYGNGTNFSDFALARYNTDGSLDTSFDGDGITTTHIGASAGAYSIKIQADGKILVAGLGWNAGAQCFVLTRYNTDGSLDTGFGNAGIVTTPMPSTSDTAYSVTLQADNKILVAGSTRIEYGYSDLALMRYNADGSLDTSFDGDGRVTTRFTSSYSISKAYTVTEQTDGKILVAGSSGGGFALVRYNSDGSLDASFSGDGKVITSFDDYGDIAYSVTVQADGEILVAGYAYMPGSATDFALARYTADGNLDTTFNVANVLNNAVSYTENGTAVVLNSNAQVYDAELAAQDNYDGSSITLAHQSWSSNLDVFSSTGNLSFSGSDAVLAGITIGTVSNSNGILSITFNSNATQARVNETLASLAYSNASDAPPPSVTINWTFNDGNVGNQGTGDALTALGTTIVSIVTINDAPTAADKTINLNEDAVYSFSTNDFGYNDVEYDWFSAVNILSLPSAGLLKFNGTPVVLNQSIPSNSIASLIFTPTLNASGNNYANFDFKVNDGMLDSVNANTITFNVTAVNDAPTSANKTVTFNEDSSYTFASNDFDYSDVENNPLVSIKIISLSNAGELKLNGATVNLNQIISTASIADLTFTPAANGNGNNYANFNFTVNDGVLDSIATNTVTFNVTPVNDVPTASDKTLTINEDTTYSLTNNDLGYNDIDNDPLASIKITSLPTAGEFKLNGIAVELNQIVPTAAISNLTFTPAANANGNNYANFSFTVNDGILDSIAANTLTLNVAAVNDAPSGSVSFSGTTVQGQILTASHSLADIDGLGAVGYQWQSSADGVNWQDIGGATANTFTLTYNEVTKQIRVVASYTDGSGTLESIGSAASSAVTVNANLIIGDGNNNALTGTSGIDEIFGLGGNDTINGGSGADSLIGGTGNDTYTVDNIGDVVIENVNEGTDTVNSGISYTLPSEVENLTQTSSSNINATGNSLNNLLTGNSGNNIISGGQGTDTLLGNGGRDTLDGGDGNDVLTGGSGKDIFRFTTLGNIDTITDFVVVDDTVQLENAVFTALTSTGTLSSSKFRVGSQALDDNDYLIYNNTNGALLYDADGNGAALVTQIAIVGIGLAMTAADFVVI